MSTQPTRPISFPVPPPPAHAWWLLGALLLIPIVVVAIAYARDSSTTAINPLELCMAVAVFGAAGGITVFGLKRREVTFDGVTLVVKAAMFTQRVAVASLDLENARVVDLRERTDLKPRFRTFGMSLPGFNAGWFRMRGGKKGFCLLTSQERVAWVPAREGTDLLVSMQQPRAFLDALRQGRR